MIRATARRDGCPHGRLAPAVLLLLVLVVACAGRPPDDVAVGTRLHHEDAGFRLTAPAGWRVQQTRQGFSLVRKTPRDGGYPILAVRRVDAGEAEALGVNGSRIRSGKREVTWRYQAWSNSRGRGHRLEAMVKTGDRLLFAEASVWDSSPTLDRALFEREFWPIVNSLDEDTR